MGDIADWTNDMMQEANPDWTPVGDPYRAAARSFAAYRSPPSKPHCNRCGSTDVRWRQQTGRWVLFSNEPGKLHQCPIDDDFEAVE